MVSSNDLAMLSAGGVVLEHAKWITAAVLLVGCVDVAIGLCMSKGRWFMVHSLANWIICWACAPDFIETLRDPAQSMVTAKPFSLVPVYLMMALHLWHCLAPWYARQLSHQDVVHHIGFAFSLGLLQLSWHWGPNSNFFLMFVCGLPGAIDYAMLSLVKEGKLDRMVEKRVNTAINTWLRGPGCCCAAWNIYSCQLSPGSSVPQHIPLLAAGGAAALCFINGQYYSERVTISFARCTAEEAMMTKYQSSHPHPLVQIASPRENKDQ